VIVSEIMCVFRSL